MNHESQLRVSGRLLSVAIVIAFVLMIATALSWFRSHMQSQEDARRAVIHRDLQNRYREFYADSADLPKPATPVSLRDSSRITKPAPQPDTAVSHTRTVASSAGSASSFVSVERAAPTSTGGPSVTVPVTINVNNGDLLSELLQVRQEVSNLQQMQHAKASLTSTHETSESVFSCVAHNGQTDAKSVEPSRDSAATQLTSHSVEEPKKSAAAGGKLAQPVPDLLPARGKEAGESSQATATTESFDFFETAESSQSGEETAPVQSIDAVGTPHQETQVDNFVPADSNRVMPMSYQSESVVAESSDASRGEEPANSDDDAIPFMEFVSDAPAGDPDPESTEEPDSASIVFVPVNEAPVVTLPANEPLEELQSTEPTAVPSLPSDRRTRLSQAFQAVRGLPPESLFDVAGYEQADLEFALISIPLSDENQVSDESPDAPFHNISMPVAIDVTFPESNSVVQTGTAATPQTSVPPVPDVAFFQGEADDQVGLDSSELEIPSSLDPLHIAGQNRPLAVAPAADEFSAPNDIFRLPDESEIAADPARDRALRIAQSPAHEEHFDTRTSEQLVPLPSPPLTIPEMVYSPPQHSIPEFMPPASMPARPVYRTRDPNASTMSLAVRRFKKRMAQVTGSVGASMPEIDRPDFEIADLPLPGVFGSQAGQTQRTPQHQSSPRSFAKGNNAQQPAPHTSRSAGSWFGMPQMNMPKLHMPQFALPQVPLPGFTTAQQDCEHCHAGDAGPTAMQRLTESASVHRAMSTIRFVGQSKTVR